MRSGSRAYLVGSALLVAAMICRVGWIPWTAAGAAAAVVVEGLCCVFGALLVLAVVVGVPAALLVAAVLVVRKLCPARSRRAVP
jgi:hypothetical protein